MNKAFTKEVEDHGDHCPVCGSIGNEVLQATLSAHLAEVERNALSSTAFFCPLPTCKIAYFDRFERTVAADLLASPVYPKDPRAPICPCFGFTCEDIEADVEAGEVKRVRQHLTRAQSDEARCTTMSPSGESCIASVQRHFMRKREEFAREDRPPE